MMQRLHCRYSTICPEDLMDKVIPDYCIEQPLDCIFWERGTNDTYQIRCADSRYSLRIYRHNIYPRDEIDFEVDALNYLHSQTYPAAFPIARKSGGYITEISAPEGIRYVLVTAFIEGSTPEYESTADCRLFGQSIAQLHTASQDFKSQHSKKDLNLDHLVDDSITAITPYLTHRPDDLDLLKQLGAQAHLAVDQADKKQMDIGFCHGDVHGFNAHLNNGLLTHFDFEECGIGFRIYDLATFKWSFMFSDTADEQWVSFLEGYQSTRKLSETDTRLIDTFVLVRHIWLIGFHVRNADDFGHDVTSNGHIDSQWKSLKKLAARIDAVTGSLT